MNYEKIKYPDGQISAKIINGANTTIRERINSYEDLFYVKSIASLIKDSKDLFIPCLFGQRSDRRFAHNQSFDLKIICDFINSCEFDRVSILDPHSDVALALINNSEKITSFNYVRMAVESIGDKGVILVSSDAGAYKKVFEYGEKLSLPVVAGVKHRDLAGNISLKFMGDVKDATCLIVDDLCDGGYTFELLGKALREQGAKKVYLYVSHGYFSKGFKELQKVLDGIYCTNSVKDITNDYYDGWKMKSLHNFVTQYKII